MPVTAEVVEFYAECPKCKKQRAQRVVYRSDVRWDFCPVCGARLDVVEHVVKPLEAA